MSADLVHAYEWDSPDTQLFVGLGLGRDEIFVHEWRHGVSIGSRIHDFDAGDLVRCFDYSPTQPLVVGYGLGSGAIHVRDMSGGSMPAVFKQRVMRKSTSISFNSLGLVAAGFEKTRGSDSVMLWDVANQEPASDPIFSVFNNEFVNSVAFVPSQPTTLVCGGSKLIREVDTRTSGAISAIATNFAKGICFNPLDDRIFSTYGDSNSLAIWDRRMLTGATNDAREPQILVSNVFKNSSKSDSRYVRFSHINNNEFSVLQDGSIIRRWQTSHIPDTQRRATQTSHLSMELHGGPAATAGGDQLGDQPQENQHIDALFVDKVFDVRTEADKVASFDYAPNMRTGELEFLCIRQSGTVFRMPVTEPPVSTHFDAFNNFDMLLQNNKMVEADAASSTQGRVFELANNCKWKVSADAETSIVAGGTHAQLPYSGRRRPSQTVSDAKSGISRGSMANDDEEDEASIASDDVSSFGEEDLDIITVLQNDVTSVLRRRALAGYGFDPLININIIKEAVGHRSTASSGLTAAWRWIQLHKSRSSDADFLQTPDLDLSYLGVLSLWDGLTEEALRPRLATGAKLSNKTVDDAVKQALKNAKGSVYVSIPGEDDAYRQLCLRLSGWNFGLQELETKLEELESHGHYEKAAGWAVFHNNVERAVESLAKSRKKNLRLMSSAVAGYLVYKDVPTNNVWREQCRRLASELSVPYLRAIFAYIADGSWLDVLDDGSLPLTERLGIALRFLPQKEVGAYLTRLTSRAIANGDLEGIILTGLTPKVLDLFQSYLDRTCDIQTVSLLVSFGWPRFLDDERIPQWIAEYRELLNAWKYFSERARFDIGRNKLAMDGLPPAKPAVQRQVFLRCSNCKKVISKPQQKTEDNTAGRKKPAKNEDLQWSWNRCPSCNHSLPPCGVCGLPLGPHVGAEIESDRWPTFCLSCNHGSHSVHARQWFEKYDICPIPTCKCLCGKSLRIS